MNVIISILFASVAVGLVVLIPWVGVGVFDLSFLFGVIVPYATIIVFFGGVIFRVIDWARSPVPFRIPTTAGQQWSLPWIKSNPIDNPKGGFFALVRMIFEIQKRGDAWVGLEDHTAAVAAVSAIGAAARHVLFASEADASVAAVTALHGDFYPVDKHRRGAGVGTRLATPERHGAPRRMTWWKITAPVAGCRPFVFSCRT